MGRFYLDWEALCRGKLSKPPVSPGRQTKKEWCIRFRSAEVQRTSDKKLGCLDLGPNELAVSPHYLRKQLLPSVGVRQTAACGASELRVTAMHCQSLEKCLGT